MFHCLLCIPILLNDALCLRSLSSSWSWSTARLSTARKHVAWINDCNSHWILDELQVRREAGCSTHVAAHWFIWLLFSTHIIVSKTTHVHTQSSTIFLLHYSKRTYFLSFTWTWVQSKKVYDLLMDFCRFRPIFSYSHKSCQTLLWKQLWLVVFHTRIVR